MVKQVCNIYSFWKLSNNKNWNRNMLISVICSKTCNQFCNFLKYHKGKIDDRLFDYYLAVLEHTNILLSIFLKWKWKQKMHPNFRSFVFGKTISINIKIVRKQEKRCKYLNLKKKLFFYSKWSCLTLGQRPIPR